MSGHAELFYIFSYAEHHLSQVKMNKKYRVIFSTMNYYSIVYKTNIEPIWHHVSNKAKSLVKKLLNKNPEKRICAANALQDEWILNNTSDQ